jgi:hypothetical protein
MSDTITLTLSKDESLVLFELLSRFSGSDDANVMRLDDESEGVVLQNLTCELERQLVEPFQPNYSRLLDDARARLRPTN